MNDYDFSTLNDKEFENIAIDLISKDKEKRFERFKAGKDSGIDGRFYHEEESQEIIQCKHYLKTGFSGLISSLKKKNTKGINEIDKVQKLKPSKYIFITSLALSVNNKITIKTLFSPYIRNDNDIYGQEDLNIILGNNPDIEKKYYKLWLSSTIILDKLLNNAIESRSEFLLENIKEKSKYYVTTTNHYNAIKKLKDSQIIIITGEPGIGKTTLAEHMSLFYIEKGFKFYNIENSINEAENIYKKNEKQIFYFDDFLGSNYLNAIENKKDSHIVKFIDRIKRDKTKIFILTSRTNILNQGLSLSDIFKSENIEDEEYIIRINSLKDIDKAILLYNHLWHSDLSQEFIDEIYIDKRYKIIINHKNFNPRLIAFITDTKKVERENITANNYWNYIIDKLDNPKDVWSKAFNKDSDEFSRIIVMLTVFNGNKIEESKLRDAYIEYIKLSKLYNDSHVSKDFETIIKEVIKYFLNKNLNLYINGREFRPYIDNKNNAVKIIEYELFNPSIADFILNKYKQDKKTLINLFLSLKNYDSLNTMCNLYSENYIDNVSYKDILFRIDYDMNADINYLVKLSSLFYDEFELESLSDAEKLSYENKLFEIINLIINKKENIESRNIYLFISTISYPYYQNSINFSSKLINKIINSIREYDEENMREVINFIGDIDISLSSREFKITLEVLKNKIENHIYNNYFSITLTSEAIKNIENIITNDINTQVSNFTKTSFQNIGLDNSLFSNNKNIEILLNELNIEDLNNKMQNTVIEDVLDSISFDLFEIKKTNIKNENKTNIIKDKIDDIDDLFER